jgi:hypothetical protein
MLRLGGYIGGLEALGGQASRRQHRDGRARRQWSALTIGQQKEEGHDGIKQQAAT